MRISPSRRRFLKFAAAATLGGASVAGPERWLRGADRPAQAGWTSFRNGIANPGVAASALPADPKQLWSLSTSDGTTSTAVIADGRVYIGTLSGDLYCLELRSGEEVWKYRSVEVVEANSFAPGFNAPAALDEKHVYIGDDQGMFHAVDRMTGKRAWQVETGAEIVGGAQVTEGKVIFGSHDNHLYCHQAEGGGADLVRRDARSREWHTLPFRQIHVHDRL